MPAHLPFPTRPLVAALCAIMLAACSRGTDPGLVPDQPVRMAAPATPVTYGDCAEARRRASEKPDLTVDRLPTPRSFSPPPIPTKSMPAAVRSARYNEVKVAVLVDTLGRADMRTFTVVKSTHPWLASSVKGAVAKWKFEPARLAGCKVARVYKWGATSGSASGG